MGKEKLLDAHSGINLRLDITLIAEPRLVIYLLLFTKACCNASRVTLARKSLVEKQD